MTLRGISPVLFVTATIAACSARSTPEAIGSRADAIIGGDADVGDEGVVAIVNASAGTLCSGSVIAPKIVLTAAHCVFGVAASDLQVLVGPDTTAPLQTVAVSSAVAYPTYTDEDTGLAGGVDLGAVFLSDAIDVTPIAVSTKTTDAELEGARVTLVGYGVDSTLASTGAGSRRSVTVSAGEVCSRVLMLGGPDGNVCFGDSGGAVMKDGALVAVISSGMADCTAPSFQTRVDAHANWIAAVLAGQASASCPSCVAPDPSCNAATETRAASDPDASVAPGAVAEFRATGGCTVSRARPTRDPARSTCAAMAIALLSLAASHRSRRGRRR